ncbi:MAG: chemotaxis protein [Campylobacterota bacterium]|nr:chemotaxis protein [Campylobacterota bacterium]
MTQEELDALMNGDMDLDTLEEEGAEEETVSALDEIAEDESQQEKVSEDAETYRVSATHNWPPPPPTDDNKMVHQLDDVTKESEAKATEIFDIIENISNEVMEKESNLQTCIDTFTSNIELFEKLTLKFPDVVSFGAQLEKNREALNAADEALEMLQTSGDSIMSVMDIMQYQDIHRQKIERVINVMRALSTYMNMLFEGKIDDEKRVTSAVHLPGDETTDDVVNSDDIEELLKSFGQ